jgi:hypothetical protein
MRAPLLTLLCILILGSLAGCTKCGFLWDDGTRSCRSDAPVR